MNAQQAITWFVAVMLVAAMGSTLPMEENTPSQTDLYEGRESSDVNHDKADGNLAYPVDDSPLDVNETIEEVEKILATYPELPRLSRSEILEILDNLTSHDANVRSEMNRLQDDQESFPSGSKSREEYAKALMLVLPFNAKDMSESKIQELYTKPPVTKLVDKQEKNEREEETLVDGSSPTEYFTNEDALDGTEYPRQEITQFPQETADLHPTLGPLYYDQVPTTRHRTQAPTPEPSSTANPPQKFSATHAAKKPSRQPTRSQSVSYSINVALEGSDNLQPSLYPTPKTTNNYYDTYKMGKPTVNYEPSVVLEPPEEHKTEDVFYVTTKQPKTSTQRPTWYQNRHKVRRPVSRTPSVTATSTTTSTSTNKPDTEDIDLGIPQDMKHLLLQFNIQDHISASSTAQPTLFMSPGNAHHTANRVSSSSTMTPVWNDNIGEFADQYAEQTKVKVSNSVVAATTTTTTTTTSTTVNPLTDLSKTAESLSPGMKELLVSLGLIPSADKDSALLDTQHEAQPLSHVHASSPTIDPTSYLSFKPLPLSAAPAGGEMHDFLASFGLVPASDTGRQYPKGYRTQKSLDPSRNTKGTKIKEKSTIPSINTDMLTDDMKEILVNLGLLPARDSKRTPSTDNEEEEINGKEHVFNPSQHFASLNTSEEESKRLNKLLATIKKFSKENATLTPEQMAAIDASFFKAIPSEDPDGFTTTTTTAPSESLPKKTGTKLVTLDEMHNSPDPLDIEELLQLYNATKNEIKRQQPNDTNTNTTTENTEERVPTFDALAESFGGGETAPLDANTDDELPPARPNGVYFLLDWNSFLEVGEGKEKVNIRIAPRVGSSRNFLPVNVP